MALCLMDIWRHSEMERTASWNECLEKNNAIKISPDKAKAKSLLETARERIGFIGKIKLEELNANFVFENYYSSLLEMMHAMVILKGFKVDNHICLGYYLRDVLRREELFRIFDDSRYKRNNLIYYGRKMNFETAVHIINKMKMLFEYLEKQLK